MRTRETCAKEVGMVAAIIADYILEKLYDYKQVNGTGYISTVEKISEWAIEFVNTHKETNWEKVLEDGLKPLSKAMPSVICWDDAVIDFANYKLSQLIN